MLNFPPSLVLYLVINQGLDPKKFTIYGYLETFKANALHMYA